MEDPTQVVTAFGNGAVATFLELHGHATVTPVESNLAVLCQEEPFHWNGTELVICSTDAVSWPDLDAAPVDVSLVAGNLRFQFPGNGATDQVDGVAPEYREQLVTYLGPEIGNATADKTSSAGCTCRLFITPKWKSEYADR